MRVDSDGKDVSAIGDPVEEHESRVASASAAAGESAATMRKRQYEASKTYFNTRHFELESKRSDLLTQAARLRASVSDLNSSIGLGAVALAKASDLETKANIALGELDQLEERWGEVQMKYHDLEPYQLAGKGAAEPPRDKLAEFNAAVEALKASPITSIAFAIYAATGNRTFEQQKTFIAIGSGLEGAATAAAFGAGGYFKRPASPLGGSGTAAPSGGAAAEDAARIFLREPTGVTQHYPFQMTTIGPSGELPTVEPLSFNQMSPLLREDAYKQVGIVLLTPEALDELNSEKGVGTLHYMAPEELQRLSDPTYKPPGSQWPPASPFGQTVSPYARTSPP
jgi:hypothetical protein